LRSAAGCLLRRGSSWFGAALIECSVRLFGASGVEVGGEIMLPAFSGRFPFDGRLEGQVQRGGCL
jgi:hypothetical protein